MIAALLWPFRKALAWAGAAFVIIGGAWLAGRREGNQKAATGALKKDLKAHERINEADTGIGATDADRIERLREFAAKHRD